MRVITNTSPLISLDRIGSVGILKELFGKVICPVSVREEILQGKAVYSMSSELEDAEWIIFEADPEETIYHKELGEVKQQPYSSHCVGI